MRFILENQGWYNMKISINIINHINRNEGKNPHDHLNRYRKITWQNATLLHNKNINELLGIEGNILNVTNS
jgi:CRISPR/Cas system-associated endonuclease Cas1